MLATVEKNLLNPLKAWLGTLLCGEGVRSECSICNSNVVLIGLKVTMVMLWCFWLHYKWDWVGSKKPKQVCSVEYD